MNVCVYLVKVNVSNLTFRNKNYEIKLDFLEKSKKTVNFYYLKKVYSLFFLIKIQQKRVNKLKE